MNYFEPYQNQIEDLCCKYHVRQLFAFGSVLTDRFSDESDIDLIADFDKDAISDFFTTYFDFKYSLEEVFNRAVDLLGEQLVRNQYLSNNINNSKRLIYGKEVC
ncbi:MAG: hypothetical protein BWZ00_01835 [Bacteroidetes bacterium ADurb.BinA174]|nr:MAG: hypothetical protein BWZ00_01835 [Bacteroidetes bacterium ADurb.BinA174]